MSNHYYLPIIYSKIDKIDYMKHIINNQSEANFIISLIKNIRERTINVQWMFSKIEENADNIFVPYYDKESNKYKKFYPDFIFWLKRGKDYKIIFIDPKGISYSNYQNKIDGFNKLFNDGETPKIFKYKDYNITFDLKLITDDKDKVGEYYKKYWLNYNDFSWIQ